MSMGTNNAAIFFAMALTTDQTFFLTYHKGSYANNAVMLSSRKPLLMRDVFLTKSSSFFPNPLSCIYVHKTMDAVINSFLSWLLVKPITEIIGWRSAVAIYLGSGLFSGFAYLFSTQLNKRKANTRFDCADTSNGAFAGFAALSLIFPKSYIPTSKSVPTFYIGVPYLAKCTYDEYIGPRYFETREKGAIEIRNWGFIGGVFFAFIYTSLVLQTRANLRCMATFWENLPRRYK
uniref:Uncharacterized protein TCIL3000_7_1270 n=1 Tax=Trypanosoma congolense (strain IL3000) TaxID=1068625 RepID=G0UPL2_TRYCI|nr:unnamed protein product [Trypanosoma congolense IL3000]